MKNWRHFLLILVTFLFIFFSIAPIFETWKTTSYLLNNGKNPSLKVRIISRNTRWIGREKGIHVNSTTINRRESANHKRIQLTKPYLPTAVNSRWTTLYNSFSLLHIGGDSGKNCTQFSNCSSNRRTGTRISFFAIFFSTLSNYRQIFVTDLAFWIFVTFSIFFFLTSARRGDRDSTIFTAVISRFIK